ncbi:hypothetical protein E4U55_004027 [Claviceps digitariae]|nr:hypothetical protein E4U55_004027 [Claviceps digitariae]
MKACIGTLSLSLLSTLASANSVPTIQRPVLQARPLQPARPFAKSPARDASKTCFVIPGPAGHDDAPAILDAFHKCNHGGTVVLDKAYTIASPLDLTFLQGVDVAISGSVTFSPDIEFWTAHTFKYAYQDASAVWRFGGQDVNIYGEGQGLIDGNGQVWYDGFAKDKGLKRPVLFVLDGLHGGSVTGLNMRNPPYWFNLIANSSDVLVSDINLTVQSTNDNPAKNTDGWDTFRSQNIVIQSSKIQNGDDCVSFKPNSTDIVVQNLVCDGSHGISVGSLGQYVNEIDIVENIYVYKIVMKNASDGARIKVWPGSFTSFQASLSGGGGSGYVRNVTYDDFYNENNDWAVEVNQCYGTKNLTLCDEHPSNMFLSDITFKNIAGTTSKKNAPQVGTIVCSEPSRCNNIQAQKIDVNPPSGDKPQWVCQNVDNKLLDVNCVAKTEKNKDKKEGKQSPASKNNLAYNAL